MNIPTILTLFRIALIPVLVLVFYSPLVFASYYSAGIFIFASITDWLDGYLARKLKQETSLGAFLDPVADKLIVAVALLLLVESNANIYFTIPAAIIIFREIFISALREWMASTGKRAALLVNNLGKIKTVTQMVAITLFLANLFSILAFCVLYVAAGLSIISMLVYIRAAYKVSC